MNIGRRKFLKFLGLATAGLAVDPLAVIVRNKNYFVNQKLGLGFEVPDSWQLNAFGDYSALRGQELTKFDSEVEKKIVEAASQSIVAVIQKYPDSLKEKARNFCPSIVFSMSPDEIPSEYETFEVYVHEEVEAGFCILTDYEVIESPALFTGKNYSAYTFKTRYLFEHKELISSTVIEDEVLLIHHNKQIYTIHMYDSPYINDVATDEFEGFKASLHIA